MNIPTDYTLSNFDKTLLNTGSHKNRALQTTI